MIERHLARLRARDTLSEEEAAAIRATISEVRDYSPKETIIHEGEAAGFSTLLIDGFLCRYKDLSDGQRQISELHVPGDFADLHSFTLYKLDHNVMALTRARVAIAPHSRIAALVETYPRIMRLYWFSTNLDAAIHREWVLSLGRRSALGRIAALFCELHVRLCLVGLTDGNSFTLPISQAELGECMGLTSVHVNRTLRTLREDGLATFRNDVVVIHDLDRLRDIADFDPAYLYLKG